MTLRERIKELCKKNNISINKLETECGFAKGYVSKLNKSTPNSENIQKIAKYFNVSVDYLMTGKNLIAPKPSSAKEHVELITLYEKLTSEQKNAIKNLMISIIK